METLVLLVFFSIVTAVFATQNTTSTSINLFGYSLKEVPMYLIVLGSLLIGLLLSTIISFVKSISTSLQLHGKDVKIKETKKTVVDLAKKNRELELEIAKLRERTTSMVGERKI